MKKQARQLGYCIRQGEEYFKASSQVGLPTRPLLLYYGAASLARALILLRQDGTHSFDYQRRHGNHHSHGLDFPDGSAERARQAKGPEEFFRGVECAIHLKEGKPWGHFPIVYESLIPDAYIVDLELRTEHRPTYVVQKVPMQCPDKLPLDVLQRKSFNALEIMKSLPDLYYHLLNAGIRPNICRGSLHVKSTGYHHLNAINDSYPGEFITKPPDKVILESTFNIDDISTAQQAALLELYRRNNSQIQLLDRHPKNLYLCLTREQNEAGKFDVSYYPSIVESINGQKFYILDPENYLPEPASLLILLFCFGMLSRYHPDAWMGTVDDDIKTSELLDTFLNICYRKFPHLILDQLTEAKHHIHQ